MNARQSALTLALLGSVWLVAADNSQPNREIAQSTRAPSQAITQRQSSSDQLNEKHPEQILTIKTRQEATETDGSINNTHLFVKQSWTPPPPVATAAEVKPTAPPLPYTYVGKHWKDNEWTVYLARDAVTLLVRKGDVIDDTYRIQLIESKTMELTYLPLKQLQILEIE